MPALSGTYGVGCKIHLQGCSHSPARPSGRPPSRALEACLLGSSLGRNPTLNPKSKALPKQETQIALQSKARFQRTSSRRSVGAQVGGKGRGSRSASASKGLRLSLEFKKFGWVWGLASIWRFRVQRCSSFDYLLAVFVSLSLRPLELEVPVSVVPFLVSL